MQLLAKLLHCCIELVKYYENLIGKWYCAQQALLIIKDILTKGILELFTI